MLRSSRSGRGVPSSTRSREGSSRSWRKAARGPGCWLPRRWRRSPTPCGSCEQRGTSEREDLRMAEGIRVPIPPGAEIVQPYPVHLPQFDGPLDLLLHLIRKDEIDLRNIPVVDICRQYHEYLVLMVELDLEVAAEFLYVEALLVQIKSQMVLPRTPAPEGG